MRKLSAFLVIIVFLYFSGVVNAQDKKEEIKNAKKTEQVTKKIKKVKKIKKSCDDCKDKSKCSDEKNTQEKK
jgi:hypothetical protein